MADNSFNLPRQTAAEFLGSLLLVTVVVGSGIMAESLSGGNDAIALLGNTLATGAALPVLILIFGQVSGAHFNPVVSLCFAVLKQLSWNKVPFYMAAQIAGGICGALLAHIMFELPLVNLSEHSRTGTGTWAGEIVATFGLILTDPRLSAESAADCSLRRRTVYNSRILVHVVHIVR